MFLTARSAAGMTCPFAFSACQGAQCPLWRWAEPAPPDLEPKKWFPDTAEVWPDDEPEAARRRMTHTEPPRPTEAPVDAEWVPTEARQDRGILYWRGGYWRESAEQMDLANGMARAMRKGYCGHAGRPEYG